MLIKLIGLTVLFFIALFVAIKKIPEKRWSVLLTVFLGMIIGGALMIYWILFLLFGDLG